MTKLITITLQDQYSGFIKTPDLLENRYGLNTFLLKAKKNKLATQFYIPNTIRFGQRMEYYFEEAIHQSTSELIARNIQIINNKQTLGELDFIIKDKTTGQTIHVELVYKFYLLDPSISKVEKDCWIGENRRDKLTYKLDKLKNHQLPILYDAATLPYLEALGLDPSTIDQQVCYKGQLYLPKGFTDKIYSLNNTCVAGNWLTIDDFHTLSSERNAFFIPQKNDWSTDPTTHTIWFNFDTILSTVLQRLAQQRSVMVWSKDEKGNIFRDFVVWW